MRSSIRVLAGGVALAAFLAVPAIGLAVDPKDPTLEPVSGPPVTLVGGPNTLTTTPGATVGAVGAADAVVYDNSAGGTVVSIYSSSIYREYNSVAGNPILASLGLPAGATLWEVDFYGYATGATTLARFCQP